MNKSAKKLLTALSILLFITQAEAQVFAPNITDAGGKKQGYWIKLDENKKKIYEGSFVNDIPSGKFTYYFETGTPKAVSFFSENGRVSRTQHFSLEGKIAGEGKYVDQKKDSLWKFYNNDGKLLSEDMYLNGEKNGICKVYYSSGQISENKTWLNGAGDGPCLKYFENGEIKYKGQNVKNKIEGKVAFNYPSGKVYAEGSYINDFKEGKWNYYKEDGTLEKTTAYIKGKSQEKEESLMTKEEVEKAKKKYEESNKKDPDMREENIPK